VQDQQQTTAPARPVIFGEVLFDHLPDGRAVLGGAPFNVAWHLQGLGLRPLLVSRVGDDAQGDQVLATMQAWGMDTVGVQRDPQRPTGAVQVTLENGIPGFHILPDQAYDHIDPAEATRVCLAAPAPHLLYHGTLAVRSKTSKDALTGLRALGLPAFIDVNLRSPWWERQQVLGLLRGARWLKLSGDELDALGDEREALSTKAHVMRARYGLDLLVVTEGEAGAQVFTPHGRCTQAAVPAEPLADTIGAGDAFTAVCLLGIIRGWPITDTVARAAELAARICMRPGATHADPGLYADLLTRWAA